MKMKLNLVFLLSFIMLVVSGGIYAHTLKCKTRDVEMYCNYSGLFKDIDNAEEEFLMLLEPPRHSNFQDMYAALSYIVGCAKQNGEYLKALTNSECRVFAYTQKLVIFYKENFDKLHDKEVLKLFEILEQNGGEVFFSK